MFCGQGFTKCIASGCLDSSPRIWYGCSPRSSGQSSTIRIHCYMPKLCHPLCWTRSRTPHNHRRYKTRSRQSLSPTKTQVQLPPGLRGYKFWLWYLVWQLAVLKVFTRITLPLFVQLYLYVSENVSLQTTCTLSTLVSIMRSWPSLTSFKLMSIVLGLLEMSAVQNTSL